MRLRLCSSKALVHALTRRGHIILLGQRLFR